MLKNAQISFCCIKRIEILNFHHCFEFCKIMENGNVLLGWWIIFLFFFGGQFVSGMEKSDANSLYASWKSSSFLEKMQHLLRAGDQLITKKVKLFQIWFLYSYIVQERSICYFFYKVHFHRNSFKLHHVSIFFLVREEYIV